MSLPDINSLDLLNEIVEVDGSVTSAEFFSISLPDDNTYTARLKMGDRGIVVDRQRDKATKSKTGASYLMVHLAAKLLDDQLQETATVFDNPTSIVAFSGTSRLHVILEAAGSPAPSRMTLADLKTHTETVLAQNPTARVTTQWQATLKMPDGTYKTILKGQRNFPPILDAEGNPTGRYSPEVLDMDSGEIAKAQVKIIRYAVA